jgi:hypothetical protein
MKYRRQLRVMVARSNLRDRHIPKPQLRRTGTPSIPQLLNRGTVSASPATWLRLRGNAAPGFHATDELWVPSMSPETPEPPNRNGSLA